MRMSDWSSVVFSFDLAFAVTAVASAANAQEAWKHGIVEAKSDSGFLFQAAEGGFAEKHDLDLEMVEFTGGPTALKALIAGELDSMEASPVVAFPAMEQNANLKIIEIGRAHV